MFILTLRKTRVKTQSVPTILSRVVTCELRKQSQLFFLTGLLLVCIPLNKTCKGKSDSVLKSSKIYQR